MNIKEILIDKIKKNGSINVAEFIQTCQFENDGYYLKNIPIGRANDFITSPEISQIFGELIGLAFIDYYYKCKKPNFPILVDLGGGNGTMMKDALRATKKIDKIP